MTFWLNERMRGIRLCLETGLWEAALVLLYSAIDTFAFLNAPADTETVNQSLFVEWCTTYLWPLMAVSITGMDLYGARCGVLHTSSAASTRCKKGDAREIWYGIQGRTGVNLMTNTPKPAAVVDLQTLIDAFEKAAQGFISDLERDQARLEAASSRIKQFFSWGYMWNGV